VICCKECLDLLHDYLDGTLSEEMEKSLKEHFEDCPPCISFFNTYKAASNACKKTLTQTEVPDEVAASLKSFIEKNIKNSP
jgi:anti-sigma factor RsiW